MQSSRLANEDSSFATVPTAPNGPSGFEDWACENFNLLEFVGEDKDHSFDLKEEPTDYNLSDEDAQKDQLYSTWQYNELLANDHNYNQQMGFPGQKNGFVSQQQQPNGLNQLADHAYQQQVYGDQTNLEQAQRPSTSAVMPPPIKEEFPEFATQLFEPSDIHRDHRSQSITSDGTSTNASYQDSMNGQGLHYEPTIKPRKYRLKPDQEKLNPVYRMKREKNNDAVRRSRDKAKRLQMEKDARLAFLENEHINNKRQIMQLEQRNQMLQDQYIRLKQLCRCGAISGRQP